MDDKSDFLVAELHARDFERDAREKEISRSLRSAERMIEELADATPDDEPHSTTPRR